MLLCGATSAACSAPSCTIIASTTTADRRLLSDNCFCDSSLSYQVVWAQHIIAVYLSRIAHQNFKALAGQPNSTYKTGQPGQHACFLFSNLSNFGSEEETRHTRRNGDVLDLTTHMSSKKVLLRTMHTGGVSRSQAMLCSSRPDTPRVLASWILNFTGVYSVCMALLYRGLGDQKTFFIQSAQLYSRFIVSSS